MLEPTSDGRRSSAVTRRISARQSRAEPSTGFARQLRQWRARRGFSQLELAGEADISQRHLSFIETGRSRPRTEVVLKLAEALDVPLRERNALLDAAGLPPCYPEMPLSALAAEPFRRAIRRMLDNHDPYPAWVLDRWWDIVDMNAAAQLVFASQVPADTPQPLNAMELMLAPGSLRDSVTNLHDVAPALVQRLRREVAETGADTRLQTLLTRAEGFLADIQTAAPARKRRRPTAPQQEPAEAEARSTSTDLAICPCFVIGDTRIATISTLSRFGSTREVTLDELRIECLFPGDDEAEAFFDAIGTALAGNQNLG